MKDRGGPSEPGLLKPLNAGSYNERGAGSRKFCTCPVFTSASVPCHCERQDPGLDGPRWQLLTFLIIIIVPPLYALIDI